ncbi:uncharacterized protein LOC124897811 [Capsicum annuum]|uniref:uncharacterized protein LOC124897811 n=1 Tax=Capsicum annuum TaxID=4072 RepID=UPI001FB0E59D|nr:uncharacterized protein LOC124897811 [Capsicum annuum]
MHNFMFQGFSKVVINTSDVIGISQVEQEKQHVIKEIENCKQVKIKSVLPSSSLDQFLGKQGIHKSSRKQHDIDTIDGVAVLPTEDLDKHNKRLDDPVEQEEIGEDGWLNSDDDMNVDWGTNGVPRNKNVRGPTTCKEIHPRTLDEREVVTFDLREAVGPTDKVVSNLSNFIETVARNPRFINLLYTNWHTVLDETKKCMWDYVNREVKRRCFDKRLTIEEMLEKCTAGIPAIHLRQLIEYWKLPEVEALSEVNSQNRKKQKWRHRMGPINFGRVRVALRRTKENNEEPLKAEMFVATRTKIGKEVQADTQITIFELENHQNGGKTPDDAFTAVFGKEKPGRVRGYSRSVTRTSLQKDEKINELKQKHSNEVTSMKKKIISEMRQEMRQFFTQLVQNNP